MTTINRGRDRTFEKLDRLCECQHPIRSHNKATPNRDLVTCSECEKPCLIHLGYQPAAVAALLRP